MSHLRERTLSAVTVVLFALGYPVGALTLAHLSPFLLILLRFAVSAGIGAVVIAMDPVAAAVIGRFVLRQRENRWGMLALASAATGVLTACLPRVLADPAIGPGIGSVLVGLCGLSIG